MYSDLINIFILIIIFIISIHIFKIFKIYDQREINKQYDMIPYENIEVTKDTERQHEPYNYSDVYEYGIFKTHPFKHPNDMDYY